MSYGAPERLAATNRAYAQIEDILRRNLPLLPGRKKRLIGLAIEIAHQEQAVNQEFARPAKFGPNR